MAVAANRQRQRVHARQEAEATAEHDLTPWVETPRSTRVSAFRYDHLSRALQVRWRNNSNHGYIYEEVPYETYRSFARAASKGRYVNMLTGGFEYRVMTPDEVQAASNSERKGLTSRVR